MLHKHKATSHKLKSKTTKYAECKMGHTVKPSSQRFRGIETWENCRDKCNEDDQCSHFKYKVLNYRRKLLIPVSEHKPNIKQTLFSRTTGELEEGSVF